MQNDTLRAVLRHVKQFGPRELVITGVAGAAETDDVFRRSRTMDVLRQENVAFFESQSSPFTAVELGVRTATRVGAHAGLPHREAVDRRCPGARDEFE